MKTYTQLTRAPATRSYATSEIPRQGGRQIRCSPYAGTNNAQSPMRLARAVRLASIGRSDMAEPVRNRRRSLPTKALFYVRRRTDGAWRCAHSCHRERQKWLPKQQVLN
jgi:hypothetical protein